MIDSTGRIGLAFFGALSASISHEIKNRMAIIHEQASLLEDYIHMAAKGSETDPERMLKIAGSIKKQVGNADVIIKNMNRLAHSTDDLKRTASVEEIIDLIAALSKRMADLHEVKIAAPQAKEPCSAHTSPFLLMNLIWWCIKTIMPFVQKNDTIRLSHEKSGDGVLIRMTVEGKPISEEEIEFPEETSILAGLLNGEVGYSREKQQCVISIPAALP